MESHTVFKNKICNLEILNRAHLIFEEDGSLKKFNAISSVFFKREGYYKNFGIYVSGLAKTIKFIDEFNTNLNNKTNHENNPENNPDLENFYYLLFIDKNIRDDDKIMKIIESSPNTIPILFKCSVYMKGEYHIDLFGTLVRFFPIFNFENNPTKIVICIDIELNQEDRRKVQSLMEYMPKGVTASGEIHRLLYNGEIPYIYAGSFCFNADKLDSNLITKFIESAHTIVGTGHYGKRTTTFGYGIDEMFLNAHLLPYIKQYSIIIEYQISYFLYHSAKYIMDDKNKRYENTNNLLKMILGDKYNPDMSTEDMYNYIDKVTYNITEKTPENNEICERFYFIIHDLVKNNKTWLQKDIMEIIDNKLRNIISASVLFEVDIDTKKVIDVKTYNQIYTDNLV